MSAALALTMHSTWPRLERLIEPKVSDAWDMAGCDPRMVGTVTWLNENGFNPREARHLFVFCIVPNIHALAYQCMRLRTFLAGIFRLELGARVQIIGRFEFKNGAVMELNGVDDVLLRSVDKRPVIQIPQTDRPHLFEPDTCE